MKLGGDLHSRRSRIRVNKKDQIPLKFCCTFFSLPVESSMWISVVKVSGSNALYEWVTTGRSNIWSSFRQVSVTSLSAGLLVIQFMHSLILEIFAVLMLCTLYYATYWLLLLISGSSGQIRVFGCDLNIIISCDKSVHCVHEGRHRKPSNSDSNKFQEGFSEHVPRYEG